MFHWIKLWTKKKIKRNKNKNFVVKKNKRILFPYQLKGNVKDCCTITENKKKILLIIVFYFENISKFNVIKLKSRGCYFLVRKKVIKQIVRFFFLVIKEIMKKIQN